ncbi:hypothetical protein C4B63_12g181 [Trypanosoma cruzi]|uniref:Uncharacterized protein n=1 Tax=Trypanosoma cruzi TaxID=5693 RepID=A0A2V2VPZ8_TRYCR|nr:hypothetical protein C4B63_12g181 [Trypanosoma cruzi]
MLSVLRMNRNEKNDCLRSVNARVGMRTMSNVTSGQSTTFTHCTRKVWPISFTTDTTHGLNSREMHATIEKLRVSLDEALTIVETDRRRHAADLQLMQRRMGDNTDTVMRRLRQELEECRALSLVEKEQNAALLAAREAEIEKLRGELKRERKRQRRVEERHGWSLRA